MKIIFHPSYDSGYYLKLNDSFQNILGTKVVGIAGLLEYLSLHNGLSGRFPSDGERAASYLAHVSSCATGSLIELSFENDSLGVSKSLLAWRDLLIMAGWTPDLSGTTDTPKLQLLSKIESTWKAQMKGSADRWYDLLELSKKQPILDGSDSIDCRCAKEKLPFIVQRVLESCNTSFVEYPEEIKIPDSLNVGVVHYNDLSDVYRQVAAHTDDYRNSVIINRDNVSLNHVLFSWGRPLQNGTIEDSNPLNLQLFKLAMSVFSRPLNINNILSYLQLPTGPVPRTLRSDLAYVLISQGGFGEVDWNELSQEEADKLKKAGVHSQWNKVIYDYINTEDENNTLSKTQRESKTTLLKYITDDSIKPDENIPVQVLKKYIGSINQWANSFANNEECEDETLKSQLNTVVSYFRQLTNALDGIEDISYNDLEKHVRTIYQPTTFSQAQAQVGSLQIISSYEQIIDAPASLIWLDCSGADQLSDRYEFLSTSERSWLNAQAEISIPCLRDLLELNRKEMITNISMVTEKITLITSDYHHNQKLAEHPLLAELKMQRGDKLHITEGPTTLPLSEPADIQKFDSKLQYHLDGINYSGRSESNTSIDTLINYPFDYTAHYIAKLGEPSKNELGSLQKITGLVAHHFIQWLINNTMELPEADRVSAIDSLYQNEFDTRLEDSIKATGLPLLLKENEVEYNNLKYQLKRSVQTLITIMKEKELVPVGCELKYEKPLGDVISDFNARIDMELKDADGNAVIFDFKWSYSGFYGDKIKEGKALQLELYRKELEVQGKHVSAVGFYLIPKCLLETPDYPTLKDPATGNVIINHVEPPHDTDIFEQIANSIAQRLDEIKEGNIEEGEGLDIISLPYSQALLGGKNMLLVGKAKTARKTKNNPNPAIESIKKDSNKVFISKPETRFSKKFQEFNNDNTPLNEQPTTYPLMKGRLK